MTMSILPGTLKVRSANATSGISHDEMSVDEVGTLPDGVFNTKKAISVVKGRALERTVATIEPFISCTAFPMPDTAILTLLRLVNNFRANSSEIKFDMDPESNKALASCLFPKSS